MRGQSCRSTGKPVFQCPAVAPRETRTVHCHQRVAVDNYRVREATATDIRGSSYTCWASATDKSSQRGFNADNNRKTRYNLAGAAGRKGTCDVRVPHGAHAVKEKCIE